MVDWAYVIDVTGSQTMAKEIVGMFIETLPTELECMQALCDKKDWGNLNKQVHKLQGAALYCGVHQIASAADALESILHTKHKPHAEIAFGKLKDEINELLECYPNT